MKKTTQQKIDERKKTFLTRAYSAIFVAGFYVLYCLLLVFSNEHWFTPLMDLSETKRHAVQFSLNFINILTLVPVIYFVANELTNLCFPGRKRVFIYTVCSLFTITVGLGILLLGMRYKFFNINSSAYSELQLFLILSLSVIAFFTLMSTLVWGSLSRRIVYVGRKTRFWYPFLVFILNTFFVGFMYTTIIHTWTTYAFLLLTSVLCDVFAYLGGSQFGKHKMAPLISPKKTWEGVIFGAAITLLIVCGVFGLFHIKGAEEMDYSLYKYLGCQTCNPGNNLKPYFWGIYVGVTLILMFVSVSGDLFFSWIKRRFNIKDFSNLIPGHGGMLDRLDAFIFVFNFYFLTTVIIQLISKSHGGLEVLWGNNNFVF